ncbi:DUF6273 domain-containing protein [Anaerotruncus rubiinfantis]|uniref:DUF6273 domain-containing protein n=1 Tax=Anaerotruncus rubiinfantis TaxID=1720200 RepID=UPI003D78C997
MIYGEELGAGGISTKTIPPQGLNLTLKGGNGKIDCTFTGITSEWLYLGQYYRLIAKPGSAPTSPMDGVQIKDVQVGAIGDAVISASIEGLTNGVQYYVRLYVRGENGWQTSIDAVGAATPVAGIALSTIAASDAATEQIIMLPEQGVPVKFLLLKHNYENSGRSLVLRKDLYDSRPYKSIPASNAYATSEIDAWFNGDYFNLIDEAVQNKISEVSFPYTPGKGNNVVTTLSRKIFALSYTELGASGSSYAKVEGTAIAYFNSNNRRIGYLSGTAIRWWTRSPSTFNPNAAWTVYPSGSVENPTESNYSFGSRPAFTLPADMLFNPEPNPDGSYSPLAA